MLALSPQAAPWSPDSPTFASEALWCTTRLRQAVQAARARGVEDLALCTLLNAWYVEVMTLQPPPPVASPTYTPSEVDALFAAFDPPMGEEMNSDFGDTTG